MPEETKPTRSPGQAKKDHESLTSIASRAWPDDSEKAERFVDQAMTKLGHKRITNYEDADPDPESPEGEQPAEPEDELAGSFEEGEENPEQPHSRGKSYWRK